MNNIKKMHYPKKKKYTKHLCGGNCSLTVNLLNCKSNSLFLDNTKIHVVEDDILVCY